MSYIKPDADKYTIYSKHGCPYCIKAKILLSNIEPKPTIIECDEYIVSNKDAFLDFIKGIIGKEYRTFPMIFHNGSFIGGYNDTKEYHDKLTAFMDLEDVEF